MTTKELRDLSLLQLRQLNNQYLNDADKLEKRALEFRQSARRIRDVHDERERIALAKTVSRIHETISGHVD